MNIHTKTIQVLRGTIHVTPRDIHDGECCIPNRCMIRISGERWLREIDPKGGDHKFRIDKGIIKFNLGGYHWWAPVPLKPKRALLMFDDELKARELAAKNGVPFVSKVKPFSWKIEAIRGDKIVPFTPERQQQINEARRRRIEAGLPDKPAYDLHRRVVGLASV